MLKCVVYLLTLKGYHSLQNQFVEMKRQMNDNGVELFLQKIQNDFGGIPDDYAEQYDKCEILLISDERTIVEAFRTAGFYVAAFYHDGNKGQMFEGVFQTVTDVCELSFRAYDEIYRRLAKVPWDILKTKRMMVRESTVEDVADFYRIYREPSITCYMEDLFQNPEEEIAYMQDYIRHMYGFYGFGMWTVTEKATGRIIGRAGFDIREGYDLPELGFVIEKAYQGKGYASEVCEAILHYAKEELLFEQIQALVEEKNEASVRLLNRLGFVFEREVVENGKKYRLMLRK